MKRRMKLAITVLAFLGMMSAAALVARGHGVKPPAQSEFGLGPRTSAKGLYVATLEPGQTLKPRKMYAIRASVRDAAGQLVEDAAIAVDGGMPQHGHGLPTRPRVTAALGGGSYEISGLRFNMGGWWEVRLTITTPVGADTVTFNLDL